MANKAKDLFRNSKGSGISTWRIKIKDCSQRH